MGHRRCLLVVRLLRLLRQRLLAVVRLLPLGSHLNSEVDTIIHTPPLLGKPLNPVPLPGLSK